MGRFSFRVAGLFALVAMLAGAVTSYEDVADGLVSVFSPTGELVSQHREDRKALQSAFEHSIATGTEGVYRIVPPERRVTIRLLNPGGGGQGGPPPDAEPPLAPVGGALSNYQASSVQISWSSNGEPDVANYRVFKSTTSATSGFGVIATVEAPGTTYTDTEYNPAIQQWYRLTARDVSGNESAFSSTFTDITAPSAPSAPTVQTNGSTSQTLALPVSAALDHASYRVERSANGVDYTQIATGVTASTYESTGLSSGVLYYHRLVDVDVSGNASAAGAAVSQTTAATSSEPYDLTLGGTRTIPFAYSWPTAPTTTATINVPSDMSLSAALATNNRTINVAAGSYGNITISGQDQRIIPASGANFGDISISGSARRIVLKPSTPRTSTAGLISGPEAGAMPQDILIDGMVGASTSTGSRNFVHGTRVAIINSSLSVLDYAVSAFNGNHDQIIIANNQLFSSGSTQSGNRLMNIANLIFVDNRVVKTGSTHHVFRVHADAGYHDADNTLIEGNQFESNGNGITLFPDSSGAGSSARMINVWFRNNTHYQQGFGMLNLKFTGFSPNVENLWVIDNDAFTPASSWYSGTLDPGWTFSGNTVSSYTSPPAWNYR